MTTVERLEATAAGDGPGRAQVARFVVRTKGTTGVRGWLHEPRLFFGAVPLRFLQPSLGSAVYWIEDTLVNGYGAWLGILVGVVITSFFIPNMLRRGTVEMLLVKPIHRPTLLVYKYIGGLSFMFINSVVAVGGVWLVLGLRSGIWSYEFLLTILILTFFFAILYAVSTLVGVLTGSAVVSILLTCLVWVILFAVGQTYAVLDQFRGHNMFRDVIPGWAYRTAEVAHFVLPRTKDLDVLTTQLLSRGTLTAGERRQLMLDYKSSITWGESLTVSGVFIAVMLGLASWRFARRDY